MHENEFSAAFVKDELPTDTSKNQILSTNADEGEVSLLQSVEFVHSSVKDGGSTACETASCTSAEQDVASYTYVKHKQGKRSTSKPRLHSNMLTLDPNAELNEAEQNFASIIEEQLAYSNRGIPELTWTSLQRCACSTASWAPWALTTMRDALQSQFLTDCKIVDLAAYLYPSIQTSAWLHLLIGNRCSVHHALWQLCRSTQVLSNRPGSPMLTHWTGHSDHAAVQLTKLHTLSHAFA